MTVFGNTTKAKIPPLGARALVLSGVFREARDWATKMRLGNDEWHYVHKTHDAQGHVEPLVYLVGTWDRRRDLPDLEAALTPCSPKVMHGDDLIA